MLMMAKKKQPFDLKQQEEDVQWIDLDAISQMTSISERTLYDFISTGAHGFPKPVPVGSNMNRWPLSEIKAWMRKLNDEREVAK